jgi:uncharacterized protein (DUF58 family)
LKSNRSFILKDLYLTTRFFIVFGVIVVFFLLGFPYNFLIPIAQTLLLLAIVMVLVDAIVLFRKKQVLHCSRRVNRLLSLGSDNQLKLILESNFGDKIFVRIIDELPFQLQKRDFEMNLTLSPRERKIISYSINPKIRGEYKFGNINAFISNKIRLLERRIKFSEEANIPVYPSILEMKKFEMKAFDKVATTGLRRLRRIGTSSEFDQIKNYVSGDDYTSINWKATSRRNALMVNHYEDEKSQSIYSVIDKSRIMKMPFNGLSLLDYAINTSLVISNIALKKQDKAGLITFSDKINTTLRAENTRSQLKYILEALYKEKESTLEANYEMLYTITRSFVKGRSLLFLYTNFESVYGMERVLPILRKLNKLHLLVVVFFDNTELNEYSQATARSLEDIYNKTIAQKFIYEKHQIIHALNQYGIQSVLTKPEELSLSTLNKYLELKSRGMI